MSTTLAETDARPKIREAAESPTAKREPIWPVLVVSLGGLATLAWGGLLVWVFGRAVGGF
jgi:hypothetical protein